MPTSRCYIPQKWWNRHLFYSRAAKNKNDSAFNCFPIWYKHLISRPHCGAFESISSLEFTNYVVQPPVAQFWSYNTKLKIFISKLAFWYKITSLYCEFVSSSFLDLVGVMAQWWVVGIVSDQLYNNSSFVGSVIDQCNWHRYPTIHSATNRISQTAFVITTNCPFVRLIKKVPVWPKQVRQCIAVMIVKIL